MSTNAPHIYHHPEPFILQSGVQIEHLQIAYHTYGTLNADRSNVVWVCHALTANSDVADWWPGTVEPGRFLDPQRNFVICANVLGSCYGTTGPMHVNPATGRPYFRAFPHLTITDVVRAHRLLASALGIGHIKALVGSSVGGFQAVEWAVIEPERFGVLALIATDAKASPWTIAIDETQRMAIEADPTFEADVPGGGLRGLAAARALGLLTYRGGSGYNLTQQDRDPSQAAPGKHRACTYQRYQGKKLCDRFDAYSYYTILDTFDTHDVGHGRGGLDEALGRVNIPAVVVGITSDIIFTPAEMKELARRLPQGRYCEIDSPFGHDGFLVEADQLNDILNPLINPD